MRVLPDTHILVWALTDDKRLSSKAREIIMDPDHAIFYSAVSTWEISIKHAAHPDNVSFSGEEFAEFCMEAGFFPLEMRDSHVVSLETLSRTDGASAHHDPFDRILIAQAKDEHMLFLTHDYTLAAYSESCIVLV